MARISSSSKEQENLEFKEDFDSNSTGEWCEMIKDIVAIANSGGGVIAIGVMDDGTPTGADISRLLAIDPADITNKVYKYTGTQFSGFSWHKDTKAGKEVACLVIKPVTIPLVFERVGTYAVTQKKQKTAFSKGTVYFRHGAKSEPGNSADLERFVERRLKSIKDFWLKNIKKVVEAPEDSTVRILPKILKASADEKVLPIQITDDPSAEKYYLPDPSKTHPLRSKEARSILNERLNIGRKITNYDLLAVRYLHRLDENRNLVFLLDHAGPRYSHQFVEKICRDVENDPSFFNNARAAYYKWTRSKSSAQ